MNIEKYIRFPSLVVSFAVLAMGFVAKGDTLTNLVLSTPGSSWSLEINTPGFLVQKDSFSQDGSSARLTAISGDSAIILSAFLEKAAGEGDAKKCRDYYWNEAQKSPMEKSDITWSETGAVAVV